MCFEPQKTQIIWGSDLQKSSMYVLTPPYVRLDAELSHLKSHILAFCPWPCPYAPKYTLKFDSWEDVVEGYVENERIGNIVLLKHEHSPQKTTRKSVGYHWNHHFIFFNWTM